MKIELLSPTLLDHSALVNEFKALSQTLEKGLGWHYLFDLVWCALQLDVHPGDKVLDAGADWGLMQFWLADQGFDVISVDRMIRKKVPPVMDRNYAISGFRRLEFLPGFRDFLPPRSPRLWAGYPKKIKTTFDMLRKTLRPSPPKPGAVRNQGVIKIYNQDLRHLKGIGDASVDCIVSISSLEHNNPENLGLCLKEFERIIKPGGKVIATLSASKENDWFHEPSRSWCYTEETLRNLFHPSEADIPSNYAEYDSIFDSILKCDELRLNLSDFYSKSGENGMPWGVWDPKYIPVGIVKDYL
jgi:hypothetical protein